MVDCHKCDICNKIYSSYKSLWKHNKNIHNNNIIPHNTNIILDNTNIINNLVENTKYSCKYCIKLFNNYQNRWKHEKKCQIIFEKKEKQNNQIKIAEIELEKYNLDKEHEIKLAEINKEIKLAEINREIELKKLEIKKENTIIKQKANSNPTIKNINKLLRAQNKIKMTNSNLTSNSNNTTNIQNNIVHNHFKIEGFGKENILDVITDKEKKLILNHGYESIEKLIEIAHIGKYDQFKNIIVTNKRENDIYMYDDKLGSYTNNDKQLILNKLILNRLDDVEEIYNEFDENNKLSESNRRILSKFFIKFLDDDKEFIDEDSNKKVFKNFTEFKMNRVNNLLFNNQDKIIQDVTSAIENNIDNNK